MANGDEYKILRGPYRDWTHRSLKAANGQTLFEAVPGRDGAIIEFGYMDIGIKGNAGEYDLIEEGGFSVKGSQFILNDGDGLIMGSNGTEGYRTKTPGAAAQILRGADAEVAGELCYRYNSNPQAF